MTLPKLWDFAIHSTLKNEPILSEILTRVKARYTYIRLKDDNDYIIGRYLGNSNVILEIDCISEFDTLLNYHSQATKRDDLWGILVSPKSLDEYETLESLLLNSYSKRYGIVNPEIGDLLKWKEYFGEFPSIVSLRISPPVCFPKELLDFCENNNILVISTNVPEGNFAFSLDYLYRVACKYSQIVCVETNTIEDALTWPVLIDSIHGVGFDEETESVVTLEKDIPYNNSLVPKKLDKIDKYFYINGDTWKLEGDLVYPGLTNIILSISDLENIDTSRVSPLEKTILEKCSDPLPGGMTELGEIRYLLRNQVSNLIRMELRKVSRWANFEISPVSDNLYLISLTLKIFKFFKVARSFLLNISEGPTMYFKEIPQKKSEKD